jgi:AcrR family transcriptional regulator
MAEHSSRCGPSSAPCEHRRRRGDVLEQAIYDAVVEQLGTVGYGALTMEGVAGQARTGKAALYRRWPSKDELVVDALQHRMPAVQDPPDTGSVRADVLDVLGRMARALNSPTGCAIQNIMSEAQRDRDFLRLVHSRVIQPRKRMMTDVLRRGAERGEVRADAGSGLLAEVGPAMLIYHFLVEGPPVTPHTVKTIVDQVLVPMLRP